MPLFDLYVITVGIFFFVVMAVFVGQRLQRVTAANKQLYSRTLLFASIGALCFSLQAAWTCGLIAGAAQAHTGKLVVVGENGYYHVYRAKEK